MKILLLTQIYSDRPISGGVRIIWNYSQELARQGAKVFVVTNVIDTNALPKHKNLKIYKVPFGRYALEPVKEDMLKSFFFSIPLILWHRIKIIHMVPIQSVCPFSRFKFGTKFIESAERTWDYENEQFAEVLRKDRKNKPSYKFSFFQKIFIRLSKFFYWLFKLNDEFPPETDAFFCRSKSMFSFLKSRGIKSRLYYLPIGVNTHEFKTEGGALKSSDKFIFLSSGALSYRKGTHVLIDAFKKFSQKHRGVSELWLIGNSQSLILQELKERAAGIEAIKFLQEVAPNRIVKYINQAHVCIAPALIHEQGPIQPNALEAMACGKPLIISDYAEARTLATASAALTFKKGDSLALARAMEELFVNKDLRQNLAENSLKYVKFNFDWSVLAKFGLEYYQELLSK